MNAPSHAIHVARNLDTFQVCGQNEVINCLLDHGADVNRLSDDGVSSLSACFVLLCPPSSFLVNFADDDRLPPVDLPREPVFVPSKSDAPVGRGTSGKATATSDGSEARRDGGKTNSPSAATLSTGETNGEKVAVVVRSGDAASRSVVKGDVRPHGSRQCQLDASVANDNLSVGHGEITSLTRTIGQIFVRRSPKVDVETALAVKPVPEILFDSSGQIVIREAEQETTSLSVIQQQSARTRQHAADLNDGLPDAPPVDGEGIPTRRNIRTVSFASQMPLSTVHSVMGVDDDQQNEEIERYKMLFARSNGQAEAACHLNKYRCVSIGKSVTVNCVQLVQV